MAMNGMPAVGAALTADELSKLVFGAGVDDVLGVTQRATETLDQLAALLHSISDLAEDGQGRNGLSGTEVDRLHTLVGLGRYVAEDAANIVGVERERMAERAAAYRAGGEA